MSMNDAVIEIDGAPATIRGLSALSFLNYAHSTAMQVRGHGVRGLALHLTRLEEATRELFGTGLDDERVRALIRNALNTTGVGDATVRVYVFEPEDAATISVLVAVSEPSDMPSDPRTLQSAAYQRPLPHIKHVGNFGKLHLNRIAEIDGYDGVLLTGPDGLIAEGATTNIGFFDGDRIIWPAAPALRGITMRLVSSALPSHGMAVENRAVYLSDLVDFRNGFVTNSRGIGPVSAIDKHTFPLNRELMQTLRTAYRSVPLDAI